MQFQVIAAQAARTLPPRDGFAPKRVDHLTLRAPDGGTYLASVFVAENAQLPAAGGMVDGELGDPDPVDTDRRRFRITTSAQAAPGAAASPPSSPPSAPAPPPASAGPAYGAEVSRYGRIERQHAQEMALRYAAIQLAAGQLGPEFTLFDVFALASAFEADVNPPHSPARDIVHPTPAGAASGSDSADGAGIPDVEYTGESGW